MRVVHDRCCAQDANAAVVQRVLEKVRDVDAAVERLPAAACDTLMKYIYRGLKKAERSGAAGEAGSLAATMLKWHSSLTKKAGVACIVRVLADRRNV